MDLKSNLANLKSNLFSFNYIYILCLNICFIDKMQNNRYSGYPEPEKIREAILSLSEFNLVFYVASNYRLTG